MASSDFGHVPENGKANHHQDRKNFDAPMIGLDVDFDQAVQKGCKPQEPLKEGRRKNDTHD